VVIMHTHAAHGVSPREAGSGTRYCVVTAYRNPVSVLAGVTVGPRPVREPR